MSKVNKYYPSLYDYDGDYEAYGEAMDAYEDYQSDLEDRAKDNR